MPKRTVTRIVGYRPDGTHAGDADLVQLVATGQRLWLVDITGRPVQRALTMHEAETLLQTNGLRTERCLEMV